MRIYIATFILACALIAVPAQAYYNPGTLSGYVNDFAEVIEESTQSELETTLDAFEKEKGHEVAVVTINSMEGDVIENFANELFREWGIGKEAADNGVLFLIAIDDRKMRIEVGYGLEGALTDLESSWILDNHVTPEFKAGDYNAGIKVGTTMIMEAIQDEIVTYDTYEESQSDSWGIVMGIGFFVLYFFFIISGLLAQSKAWWPGGVIGAIAGVIIAIASGWFLGIVIFAVLGALFDWLVSKFPPKGGGKGKGGWSSGGWSSRTGGGWSSGGSSGGFGGFGGGSSGGGGASGSW